MPATVSKNRPPRYADEDVTVTTGREIRGWYAYSAATEIFAVCGVGEDPPSYCLMRAYDIGSFLPVTLEQLARENGFLWSDRSTPCTAKATPPSAATMAFLAKRANDRDNREFSLSKS